MAGTSLGGTVDQSQPQGSGSSSFGDEHLVGQTFTAGASGLLDRVDLMLDVFIKCVPDADATIEIRAVDNGVPTDTVLAGATVLAIDVFRSTRDFIPAHFASPPKVTAGTQYAIVASAPGAGTCQLGNDLMVARYQWGSQSGNPYPNGTMALSDDSGASWTPSADVDAAFRTYVVKARCGEKVATRVGTPRSDVLVGTPGVDVIVGLGGADVIRGLGGRDRLCGAEGEDKIKGGGGPDFLNGGRGRDVCAGGAGQDVARKCEVERSI